MTLATNPSRDTTAICVGMTITALCLCSCAHTERSAPGKQANRSDLATALTYLVYPPPSMSEVNTQQPVGEVNPYDHFLDLYLESLNADPEETLRTMKGVLVEPIKQDHVFMLLSYAVAMDMTTGRERQLSRDEEPAVWYANQKGTRQFWKETSNGELIREVFLSAMGAVEPGYPYITNIVPLTCFCFSDEVLEAVRKKVDFDATEDGRYWKGRFWKE